MGASECRHRNNSIPSAHRLEPETSPVYPKVSPGHYDRTFLRLHQGSDPALPEARLDELAPLYEVHKQWCLSLPHQVFIGHRLIAVRFAQEIGINEQ